MEDSYYQNASNLVIHFESLNQFPSRCKKLKILSKSLPYHFYKHKLLSRRLLVSKCLKNHLSNLNPLINGPDEFAVQIALSSLQTRKV